MFLTDFVQYWFHRAFHRIPFLWGFHAVHHSAQKMDWLAGSRMHIVEIIGLRVDDNYPHVCAWLCPKVHCIFIFYWFI